MLFGRPLDTLFRGLTDCHSHILPGVDDGFGSMDESLAVLARYEGLGVSELWLTPHIGEDCPNTTAGLRERFAELREAYRGPVRLQLSAENMLDSLFASRLAAGDLLPYGREGRELLVETSYFTPPIDLYGTLERIKSAGYFPVLAHPERYVYMTARDYDRLEELDIRLQLNIFSLIGMYGGAARERARRLVRAGRYCRAGTDLHSPSQLDIAVKAEIKKKLAQSIAEILTLPIS